MNLHTERIRDNASEPSEGISIIVCSSNRYYKWSIRLVESDDVQFGAHHFGKYHRPEAVQVVLAKPTHENPDTKVDFGLNDRGKSVFQSVDQLLLDRWKRRQELVLLTTKQHSPHVHGPKLIFRFPVCKDVCRGRRGHFSYSSLVFEGCQNDNRSHSPRKSTRALLSVSTQAWTMNRKSIPASAEQLKKRLSLMMSETTPRQVLIATEIRVISRNLRIEVQGPSMESDQRRNQSNM